MAFPMAALSAVHWVVVLAAGWVGLSVEKLVDPLATLWENVLVWMKAEKLAVGLVENWVAKLAAL
jgi:hypothetical protein